MKKIALVLILLFTGASLFGCSSEIPEDASYIDSGGSSYSNGKLSVNISWASFPHFFKNENIIVLYVGEDSSIIEALEDIMGEQFAGYKE